MSRTDAIKQAAYDLTAWGKANFEADPRLFQQAVLTVLHGMVETNPNPNLALILGLLSQKASEPKPIDEGTQHETH